MFQKYDIDLRKEETHSEFGGYMLNVKNFIKNRKGIVENEAFKKYMIVNKM